MIEKILIPTDGTENSRQAIDRAIEIAKPVDASIHALSITSDFSFEERQDQLRSDPSDAAESAIVEAKEMVEGADLDFTSSIREGTTHEQILGYADENDIEMIVMATHGRTGLQRVVLGSVAEKTIRNSTRPVLIVPPT
jgi:nucleotide-binding universal stress UspA family protein